MNRYSILSDNAKKLAELIVSITPKSQAQSQALIKLKEAVFWANQALLLQGEWK